MSVHDRAPRRCVAWAVTLALALVAPAPPVDAAGGLLARVLRILGVTASPGELKSAAPDAPSGGHIVVVDVASGTQRVLTAAGAGYAWPIFTLDGRSLLALRGDELVTISIDGDRVTSRKKLRGVTKLVGVDRDRPAEVLVLQRDSTAPIAVLSLPTATLAPVPFDAKVDAQRRMLAHLAGETRVYDDASVFVRTETKKGPQGPHDCEDVYLARAGAPPRALSACEDASYRQPTLSADGRRAAYVRSGW